jgi:hypothetical protein
MLGCCGRWRLGEDRVIGNFSWEGVVFLSALRIFEICPRDMTPVRSFRWVAGVIVVSLWCLSAEAQVSGACTGMGSIGAILYGGQNRSGLLTARR